MEKETVSRKSSGEEQKKIDATRAPVTSRDVARLAGVSQSAVSRVFTPGASVSEATRELVLSAANELGYKPNAFARGLITRRSRLVGLVFPRQMPSIYSLALADFCQRLHAAGYRTLIITAENYSHADDAVQSFFDYQIEGLVVASSTLSSQLAHQCAQQGLPVIQFARRERDAGTSVTAVLSDNRQGGQLAAKALLAAGCSHLAYIAGNRGTSTNEDRYKGYLTQLKKQFAQEPLCIDAHFSYEGGCQGAHQLMHTGVRVDGVFCASDMIALGFIDTLRSDYGMRVPEDISVIGFDDSPEASWKSYSLTTIRQDVPRLVDEACALLFAQMEEHASGPVTRKLPVELIVRGTLR